MGIFDRIMSFWGRRNLSIPFSDIFFKFQEILKGNQRALEIIADLGEKSGGEFIFDRQYLSNSVATLSEVVHKMVNNLNILSGNRYIDLFNVLDRLNKATESELKGRLNIQKDMPYVIPFQDLRPDYPELVGGKVNTLGEMRGLLKLSVPDGFVITASAYKRIIEQNDLEERIHGWVEAWMAGKMSDVNAASQIRLGLLSSYIPRDIEREIKKAVSDMEKKKKGEGCLWALRSSAFGENEECLFAGIFDTFLNVPSKEIFGVYKKVLASLFSPKALIYRLEKGLLGEETAMAVACQLMVDSRASGVAYSLDIQGKERDAMLIQATYGLGRLAVEGKVPLDSFVVSRVRPFKVIDQEIVSKERKLIAPAGGGERDVSVPEKEKLHPALSEEGLQRLADIIMTIERFYKRPQDVEWCMDMEGRCWILQSRPLLTDDGAWNRKGEDLSSLSRHYPVLIENKGKVVYHGVGVGPVFKVMTDQEMDQFPEGGVLVSRYTAPWLAKVLPRASAVMTEKGSATSHLATVAREFRVPMLVEVEGAFDILEQGKFVTVDTEDKVVYSGLVKELLQFQLLDSPAFKDFREFRILRRILKRIAPLNLVDPQKDLFSPSGCRTYHDIVRFIHEKAVSELIDHHQHRKSWKGAVTKVLDSKLPLGIVIVDIGNGLVGGIKGRKVRPEQIVSLPFRALWNGLSSEGTWKTAPVPIDFRGMMSSLTRTFSPLVISASRFTETNLAVLTKQYMNLHLMLGYHFNLIDAHLGEELNANYIYFRFLGGVSDHTRLSRRVMVVAEILSRYDFKVNIKGDLVVARIDSMRRSDLEERLEVIGRLIGFSRQLDVLMLSDQHVEKYVNEFLDLAKYH